MFNNKFLHILCFFILTITSSCKPIPDNIKRSPQYNDGKFVNTVPRLQDRNFLDLIQFLFIEERTEWPKWIKNNIKPNFKKDSATNVITFINHATFLAEVDNKRLLFDPIFSDNAGPVSWIGVKRHRAPAVTIENMPHIDYIFISHNHYDHLDLPSLKFLSERDKPLIFVPLGDKYWLDDEDLKNVVELDWWQDYKINKCFKVTFVPAQHSSARTPFDRDKSLWGGYVVNTPSMTLFHAGDTGYSNHFKDIGKRFSIDIAMLPIGDYEPAWFLEYVHMNPKQALKAHVDLGSKQSYSMHSETFPLSTLGYKEAEKEFYSVYKSSKIKYPFDVLEVGESKSFPVSGVCN
jgi:L-ascorbate metabolism protein UlaG (beta-lactamase superfamily)